jgi:hypothetical protein
VFIRRVGSAAHLNVLLCCQTNSAGQVVLKLKTPCATAPRNWCCRRWNSCSRLAALAARVKLVVASFCQPIMWGKNNPAVLARADQDAHRKGRGDHHGLKLSEALGRMSPGNDDDKAHATRPHRFFANLDHQDLFRKHYASLF